MEIFEEDKEFITDDVAPMHWKGHFLFGGSMMNC